jgi:glycine cleavage system transcriptional repressor
MARVVLLTVLAADRPGLVATVADTLFNAGVNLRDAGFATLGSGAEFVAVCDLPEAVAAADIVEALKAVPELAGGEVRAVPWPLGGAPPPPGRVTHRITVSGGDQLGLVARLADIFRQNRANIVRMEAQKLAEEDGGLYVTRFAVSIPEDRIEACLAAIANTAGTLGLSSTAEAGGL